MLAQPALHPYALPASSYLNKGSPTGHLYLHQQHTVEVIQLIEVPAPPPRSTPCTSSLASSSFYSSSCSSDEDSEQDESVGSSYCSSDEQSSDAKPDAPVYDDTYKTRLNRVLAWREGFSKTVDADESLPVPPSTPVHSSSSSSLKRKADSDYEFDVDDDMSSQSSKRSRSHPPQERIAWQQRRLSAHSCPACDAGFSTLQSLRDHGKRSAVSDACREAVEYGLEP